MLGRKIDQCIDAASQFEAKKVKRYRSAFTTGQVNYLEKQFKKCPYIGNTSRKEVANVLNIPERAIKIWFQNRRMKEKKEVVNLDYNVDRQNNVINNLELANNTLNNVHAPQLANDRYSLQSVMSYNKDNINFTYRTGNVENNSKSIRSQTLNQETAGHGKSFKMKDTGKGDILASEENAKLSQYNFNKVYNNMSFTKYLEKNNNEVINKNKQTPKLKHNTEGLTKQSGSRRQCDDLPEDLSASNNKITAQNHAGHVNMHATYVPFCNSQNYFTPCVSSGNIIWKPVSVMPVITPNNLPLPVPENQTNGVQSIVQNTVCNCNCHSKKSLNYDQGTKGQPQYVIAIPYNNS